MKISKIGVFRFIALFVSLLVLLTAFPKSTNAVSARAYALVDQPTGRVIFCCNGYARLPMASTTKIMTGLIAVESGKLDTTFTVPEDAIRVEGSSMGLVAGEKLTLRELTYGLLLESGNDAANTIAVLLSGSTDAFVKKMNERAKSLGLSNTHYDTPSGLDGPDHYTSAIDLAHLAAYAMKNPDFAKIVGTETAKIPYDGVKDGRTLYNHNRLLSFYKGAIGVKTGFTKKSGRCLVSCAKRDGLELVAATLNGYDDWNDHKSLLDNGFKTLECESLPVTLQENSVSIVGGVCDSVPLCCSSEVTAALRKGEKQRVKMETELSRFYYAPVKKGQTLGHAVFTVDGETVATADIKASQDVAAQGSPKKKLANQLGFFQKKLAVFQKFRDDAVANFIRLYQYI